MSDVESKIEDYLSGWFYLRDGRAPEALVLSEDLYQELLTSFSTRAMTTFPGSGGTTYLSFRSVLFDDLIHIKCGHHLPNDTIRSTMVINGIDRAISALERAK